MQLLHIASFYAIHRSLTCQPLFIYFLFDLVCAAVRIIIVVMYIFTVSSHLFTRRNKQRKKTAVVFVAEDKIKDSHKTACTVTFAQPKN